MKDGEIRDILNQHEKDLSNLMGKLNKSREKKMGDMREKLAERRRHREEQLMNKHSQEVRLNSDKINNLFLILHNTFPISSPLGGNQSC